MQSSRLRFRLRLLAGLLALTPALAPAAGERPMVNVECKPTDEKLVFHCMFEVMGKKSHEPIEGAAFKVNADMPNMPLAHNVRPIRPEPVDGKPGSYEGRIELEMLGEWALKLTFDAPVRDVVIEKVTFGDAPMAMDHSKTDHGEKKKTDQSSDAEGVLERYDANGDGRITCREARRHRITPVERSHPAYQYMDDRDGDGVVCE